MASTNEVTIEKIRINGKVMTASLFRQLYEEKPFNSDFDLLYEINGKVLQKNEYVIFTTPLGPRKFDISKYKNKLSAQSIENNLYCALHNELSATELRSISADIYQYYRQLAYELNEDDFTREIIFSLLYGKVGYSKLERENYHEILLSLLDGDFKATVYCEYQKSLDRIETRNQLVKIFNNAPQIFV